MNLQLGFFYVVTFSAAIPYVTSSTVGHSPLSNKNGRIMGEDMADMSCTGPLVEFRLFTRKNLQLGSKISIGDVNALVDSGFNSSLPIKVATHGYMNDKNDLLVTHLKNGLFSLGDFNYFTVDWSNCAKMVLYEQAVACSRTIGHCVGYLIEFLADTMEVDPKEVHLIAPSLGAEAISFVSDVMRVKVGRISALDPAGPLFNQAGPSDRLDPTDADFVDVIHTNMMFYGVRAAVGTVDFFPNGGNNQPGCSTFDLNCNHAAAVYYFLGTVDENNRRKYVGQKCESFENAVSGNCSGTEGVLGYDSIFTEPGIYYLRVTDPPRIYLPLLEP